MIYAFSQTNPHDSCETSCVRGHHFFLVYRCGDYLFADVVFGQPFCKELKLASCVLARGFAGVVAHR
ncbi:conserved hypothetical protein [Mycobacterium ulcerans Agy99]|uniref:Uncharacterized protein n=1 Tax=Mycobacterium ulcerans (strain Agy99) TaxID=362242 RepID=A0PNA7_MYCUA|nr:conserved hypothetical protein [Mycobacterium ulcerans Agy99]